ncbi:hypothetical protein ACT7DL_10600 [Bacillus paranthracis]
MASELDIVQKSGAWYSYNEERLGQGRENSKQFLKENTDLEKKLPSLFVSITELAKIQVLKIWKIQVFLIKVG